MGELVPENLNPNPIIYLPPRCSAGEISISRCSGRGRRIRGVESKVTYDEAGMTGMEDPTNGLGEVSHQQG